MTMNDKNEEIRSNTHNTYESIKMAMGWTETQTWTTMSVYLNKVDSQRTMTLTDNKEERPRKTKDLQRMMHHALASTTQIS